MARVNDAVVERLERVIEALQDNSIKMGQMLAVHDEKLDKQDRIDAVLFEKVESVHREVNRRAEEIKADVLAGWASWTAAFGFAFDSPRMKESRLRFSSMSC